VLRGASWAARGLRVPARNALLADVVPAGAYGFERTMGNLGAVFGPLLALGMVAVFSVRTAIAISVIPGLQATGEPMPRSGVRGFSPPPCAAPHERRFVPRRTR